MARRVALGVLVVSLCAQAQPLAVTVVVQGDSQGAAREAIARTSLPVELRFADAPNELAPPRAVSDADVRLALARAAYVDAEFTRCLSQLEPDSLISDALGQWQRTQAARVLLWRSACYVGAGRREAAQKAAREMGALSLEMPPDAGAVTPEVEAVVARALKAAAGAEGASIRIESKVAATVSLDGRRDVCSTPCTLRVVAGMHVVRIDADGFEPDVRMVRVAREDAAVEFQLALAPPELAASQWAERYARSREVDSARSVRLLATALRAPRLLLVTAERESSGARLRGVLSVDGEVAVRSERSGEVDPETEALVRDLLVRGQVVEPAPPLYRRAGFWISVGVAAAAAAAGTAAVLNRRVVTQVTLAKEGP
ncbi:MAG: PEGA domain-containing protein [Myxococcota bacterium]